MSLAVLGVAGCGRSNPAPTKIPATPAPSAVISMGLPSGYPTEVNGKPGPSPRFRLTLDAYAPGDTFVLDFSPPDPSFVLYHPEFCGPVAQEPCHAGGVYLKGPFYGLQLVGTMGHYRFQRAPAHGRETVIAEGDVDVTQWSTVDVSYPPKR